MSVLPSFRPSVLPSFRPSVLPSIHPSRFVSGAEHKNRERYLNQTWHKDRSIGELVPFDSLGFFFFFFFNNICHGRGYEYLMLVNTAVHMLLTYRSKAWQGKGKGWVCTRGSSTGLPVRTSTAARSNISWRGRNGH